MNVRLRLIWRAMLYRCYNPKHQAFHMYGGKGISVCEEWRNSYAIFERWAISRGYKDDLTIDRIDSSKGYNPGNCRWLSKPDNSAHGNVNPLRKSEDALFVINLRKELHLSQSKLAKCLMVTERTVQNWEQGIRKPYGPAKKVMEQLLLQK